LSLLSIGVYRLFLLLLTVQRQLEHNFHEVAHELLQFELYATPLFTAMNKATWNKISPEDQEIILEIMDQLPAKIGEMYDSRLEADKLI
jgi:TRAP-type C4-dicarboxylate transport system substrate-binding protein